MTDWTSLALFDGIDLSESYVLGWQLTSSALVFDLDVALVPGHPRYRTPLPGERTCWVRGNLRFPEVLDVNGLLDQHDVIGATDATGAKDYGNIDGLSWANGRTQVCGEFGDVTLASAQPQLDLAETRESAI